MTRKRYGIVLATVLSLLLSALLPACQDSGANYDGPGLSRAEVAEIVRAETPAAAPPPPPGDTLTRSQVEQIVDESVQAAIGAIPTPVPGLSRADVTDIVSESLAQAPQPEPGLKAEEVRQIVRNAVASIPPRSAPADYTRFLVYSAISRYEMDGLEATLAHYSRTESIDGQWYVFIIDANDRVIGHFDEHLIGEDLKGPVGTDANGYNFGPEMLSATEAGKWVSYVFRNPASGGLGSGNFGDLELKNVWVVRHDGLLFASGWYIDADEFTRKLVSVAVDKFRSGGLPETVAYFASPGSALAGLEAAVNYYNTAETVEGHWFAFIGDPNGRIVAHSEPAMIGRETRELFGAAPFEPTGEGSWVSAESLRVWVATYNGYFFGSGWSRDDPSS